MPLPDSYKGTCKNCYHCVKSYLDSKQEYFCMFGVKEKYLSDEYTDYDRQVEKNGSCDKWEKKY